MYPPSPADQLADIRVEIARLKTREAMLCAALLAIPPQPVSRPGWPIQRDSAAMH